MQHFLGRLLNPESNKAISPQVIDIIVSGKLYDSNVCENVALIDRPEVLGVSDIM